MNKKHIVYYGSHVAVCGNDYVRSVIEMILEHYDTSDFDKTLFIIWPLIGSHVDEIHYKKYEQGTFIDIIRMKETYNRIIFYDLEHTGFTRMPWICDDWLNDVDEIWTPWIESLTCYDKNNSKVKFMPLRASTFLKNKHITNNETQFYSAGFFGTMTNYREKVLTPLLCNPIDDSSPVGWYVSGINQFQIPDVLADTKFLINLTQHWRPNKCSQNVVRIYEAVCMGKTVISDSSTFNYFDKACIELSDPMTELVGVLKLAVPHDWSQEYWDKTYSDDNFETYKNDCLKKYYGRIPKENKFFILNQLKNPVFKKHVVS